MSTKSEKRLKAIAAIVPPIIGDMELFIKLVHEGIDAWNRAGKILVTMLEKDSNLFPKIIKTHPSISMDMLCVFERIGRKQIYAPLLADGSIGAQKLLTMPYDIQEKYATEPIDVVVGVQDGSPVVFKKHLSALSRSDVKIVFGETEIHSIKQQAFQLEDRKKASISSYQAIPATEKPIELGHYLISYNEDGRIEITPTVPSNRSQWVRVTPNNGGWKTTTVLFYRDKIS